MESLIKYNAAQLFVKSEGNQEIKPVSLVTDFNFSFQVQREYIGSVGFEEKMLPVVKAPVPTFSFSYFVSDFDNEALFGFITRNEDSVQEKKALFSNFRNLDVFFLSEENGISDMNKINKDDLTACFFTEASLVSYNLEVLKAGIKANVVFVAQNISFQRFKSLTGDLNISLDEESKVTTINNLIINPNQGPKDSQINKFIGGFDLDFFQEAQVSLNLPYKQLFDFGQIHHKRVLKYPIEGQINISAIINKNIYGDILNILKNDKKNNIVIYNGRKGCFDENQLIENDGRGGILIKGALLNKQDASLSNQNRGFLKANISLDFEIYENYGMWMSKHIPIGSTFVTEDVLEFDFILERTGEVQVLSESALIIFSTMKQLDASIPDFKTNLNY